MSNVVIYITPICPYCNRARRLLEKKGVDYAIIDVGRTQQDRVVHQNNSQRTLGCSIAEGAKRRTDVENLQAAQRCERPIARRAGPEHSLQAQFLEAAQLGNCL